MKSGLPQLPFEINALEPYISGKTLMFHHEKYHQVYVANLNKLITGTKFENKDFETIIKVTEGPIFNNAALAWNHAFYFSGLIPGNNHIIKGSFADVNKKKFWFGQILQRNFRQICRFIIRSRLGLACVESEGIDGNTP